MVVYKDTCAALRVEYSIPLKVENTFLSIFISLSILIRNIKSDLLSFTIMQVKCRLSSEDGKLCDFHWLLIGNVLQQRDVIESLCSLSSFFTLFE